jgi:hypothetical protein
VESLVDDIHLVYPQRLLTEGDEVGFNGYTTSVEGESHFLLDCRLVRSVGGVHHDGFTEDALS